MNAITLLDRFTYVAPSAGGTVLTPWVSFPSDYKNAELWIDTKTHDAGATITIDLQSSMDTTQEEVAATESSITPGNAISAIASELGPLVRLKLSTTAGPVAAVLSVYLVPKHD